VRFRDLAVVCLSLSPLVGCGNSAAPPSDAQPAPGQVLLSMRADADDLAPRPTKTAPPPVDEVAEAIARYEKLLLDDLDNPDNADEMLALANLYLQKRGDLKRAAQWYREYVYAYATADNPQSGLIFVQLLSCYEQLKDEENTLDTCRQMLKVFPPSSQEYLYADKLMRGLDVTERVPLPQPAPPASEGEGEGTPALEVPVADSNEGAAPEGEGSAPAAPELNAAETPAAAPSATAPPESGGL
jgi:tetratricopeptide (TPR) repeat protein